VTRLSSSSVEILFVFRCRSHRKISSTPFMTVRARRADVTTRRELASFSCTTFKLGSDRFTHCRLPSDDPSISITHLMVSRRRVLCAALGPTAQPWPFDMPRLETTTSLIVISARGTRSYSGGRRVTARASQKDDESVTRRLLTTRVRLFLQADAMRSLDRRRVWRSGSV
jgi:hypothetical protein